MVKVTVRNDTNISIKIQEGNAGVFAEKGVLKPRGKCTLDLDPNATYREYVLIRLPENKKLEPIFTSDDVAELKEIVVKLKENSNPPEYIWENADRKSKQSGNDQILPLNNQAVGAAINQPAVNAPQAVSEGRKGGIIQWFKNIFK